MKNKKFEKNLKDVGFIICICVAIIFLVISLISIVKLVFNFDDLNESAHANASVMWLEIAVISTWVAYFFIFWTKKFDKFDNIDEAIPIHDKKDGEEDESNNAQQGDSGTKYDNDISPLRLMRYNLNKIQSYYKWSLLLSVLSFIFAVGMSAAGIFLIWNIVFSSSSLEKVDIIGIVGGAASEFVAVTAMVAFRLSLKHLKRYHSSLHEDQRVMTSLSIIDKISNDKDRDEMYKKVIDYEMQLSLKEVTAESKKEKNDN